MFADLKWVERNVSLLVVRHGAVSTPGFRSGVRLFYLQHLFRYPTFPVVLLVFYFFRIDPQPIFHALIFQEEAFSPTGICRKETAGCVAPCKRTST